MNNSRKNKKNPFVICIIFLLCFSMLSGCATGDGGNDTTSANTINSADETHSKPTQKRVAITFDDGPHNVRTTMIVDELAKYGFNATFFVVGNRVDGSAYNGGNALKYAYDNGNEIAIHGYTHDVYYNKCDDATYNEEINKTEKAIKDICPSCDIKLMRPIGGAITQERVSESDYSIIMWSVDSEDWKYKYKSGDSDEVAAEKVDTIVENVMSGVQDGDIILLHDIYESTYDATVIILKRLYEEGYDVVTVSELLGSDMRHGQKYSSGTPIDEIK